MEYEEQDANYMQTILTSEFTEKNFQLMRKCDYNQLPPSYLVEQIDMFINFVKRFRCINEQLFDKCEKILYTMSGYYRINTDNILYMINKRLTESCERIYDSYVDVTNIIRLSEMDYKWYLSFVKNDFELWLNKWERIAKIMYDFHEEEYDDLECEIDEEELEKNIKFEKCVWKYFSEKNEAKDFIAQITSEAINVSRDEVRETYRKLADIEKKRIELYRAKDKKMTQSEKIDYDKMVEKVEKEYKELKKESQRNFGIKDIDVIKANSFKKLQAQNKEYDKAKKLYDESFEEARKELGYEYNDNDIKFKGFKLVNEELVKVAIEKYNVKYEKSNDLKYLNHVFTDVVTKRILSKDKKYNELMEYGGDFGEGIFYLKIIKIREKIWRKLNSKIKEFINDFEIDDSLF